MSAFLLGFEKGLPVGCTLPGGIHDTQNLPELSPRSSKLFRERTPHSLPGRFKLLKKCCPGQRTEQSTATGLLLQPSSERSRGEVSKNGDVDPRVGNYI